MGAVRIKLTGLPYRRELDPDVAPIRGAGPMVEKSPPTNTFVLTRLIGGKLRALYNEEPQLCSSRMADLLETLASANRKVLAETSPPEDASGLSAAPRSK
jgi:hypothetical protein